MNSPLLTREWQIVGHEYDDGDGRLVWDYYPFSRFTIHEGRDKGILSTVTKRDPVTNERMLLARLAT